MIPNEKEALELHKKYGSNEKVIEHCKVVSKVAQLLAKKFEKKGVKIDIDAVVAGALLHDIGRSVSHSPDHGLVGSKILEKEGVDRKVVEIVKRHVGAGITREEALRLGMPDSDYVPRTTEEKIVCFSDKMVDHNKVRNFEVEVLRFKKEGHDVNRLIDLKESLAKELKEDPEKIVLKELGT